MDTLEDVVRTGGSRLRWIDYRIPLFKNGVFKQTAHLHISGHGKYDTGTFAYNLIRRGHRHGVRMVGTLKSAPDINVLAIFEK
jgi:hypothetical protein